MATDLGGTACDGRAESSVCADACGEGISVFVPVVWRGEEPVTATFELYGDRRIEAEFEPGVAQWLGPLQVNEAEVERIGGQVRVDDCTANISDEHDYSQGGEEAPDVVRPAPLVGVGVLAGLLSLVRRRR